MPADDLILNVRQIAGYTATANAMSTDMILMQRGGLGGPYLGISPAALVATALANGGGMAIGGQLLAAAIQAGSLQASNGAFGLLGAQKASIVDFDASFATLAGQPIASQVYVDSAVASLANSTVWSFNGRRGDIGLWLQDILAAGGAPNFSPVFGGEPRAPTPAARSHSSRLATTAFVHRNSVEYINGLLKDHPFVFTFNGRSGDVVLTPDDVGNVEGALLNSPALTGTPTAPTPASDDNSQAIATTAFVNTAINDAIGALAGVYAPIFSPAFLGLPTGPTAAPGTSTGQLATTAFVQNAIVESTTGVASFNGRTGAVELEATDLTDVGGALLFSPIFTGTPTAPTAPPATNSAQIATCAWVLQEIGGSSGGVESFNGRNGVVTLNTSDIVSAGGAPLASPIFTGAPQGPTAPSGDSSDQLATTAYVMDALNVNAGVTSFNSRTGAITLTFADVSAAGGAPLVSPAFSGQPSAPTPAANDNSTRLATTAYVAAALAAVSGVSSFNGRTGAIILTAADLATSQVGGPFLPMSGGTLTGALTLAASAATSNLIDGAAGVNRALFGTTAGVLRWGMILGDSSAESGSNAGSNFSLFRYSDAGASLGAALTINRATGLATFAAGVTSGGQITMAGALVGCTNIASATIGSIGGVIMPGSGNLSAGGTVSAAVLAATGNLTAPVATIGGVTFQGGGNFVSGGVLTTGQISVTQITLPSTGNINYGGLVFLAGGNLYAGVNNGVSCGLAGNAWFQCAAYAFAQQSDVRGKRNITIAPPGALDAVLQIPVHRFNYTTERAAAPAHIGWLAQEVQMVAPANVLIGDDDEETLSIELGAMLATLWEAVQELTAKVHTLEAAA